MVTKIRQVRVVLSKSKLDVHDRGIRYIAKKMTEFGWEVILTRHGLVDSVVATAIQEDANVIGLSFFSGDHLPSCSRILLLLNERGLSDIPVIVGGIIPDGDVEQLRDMGVKGVFGPGSRAEDAINLILDTLATKEGIPL